jgi:hypothetical protein
MDIRLTAAAVLVVIIILIVLAIGLTYKQTTVQAVNSTTIIAANNNSTGLSNAGAPKALAPGCTGSTEFNCTKANVTTSGLLSLNLTSRLNATLYNIHVACIAYNSTTNRPTNASSWYTLTSLGTPKQANFTGTSIPAYGTKSVASLQCYTASGLPVALGPGQVYKGLLLINYTATDAVVTKTTSWTTAGAAEFYLNAMQTA